MPESACAFRLAALKATSTAARTKVIHFVFMLPSFSKNSLSIHAINGPPVAARKEWDRECRPVQRPGGEARNYRTCHRRARPGYNKTTLNRRARLVQARAVRSPIYASGSVA